MSKPSRPYSGFLFKEGAAYKLTCGEVLNYIDSMKGVHRPEIISNEMGIRYDIGVHTISVPYTSECFAHLQRELSEGFTYGWQLRNPGKLLTEVMDTAGDQLIEDFGIEEFQRTRQSASARDEQMLARLAQHPQSLPPQRPKLRVVK